MDEGVVCIIEIQIPCQIVNIRIEGCAFSHSCHTWCTVKFQWLVKLGQTLYLTFLTISEVQIVQSRAIWGAHYKTLEKDLQIKLKKKKQVRNVVLKHAKNNPVFKKKSKENLQRVIPISIEKQ